MIHIVFQEADVTVLRQAIEMDETMQGEVLLIADDYAVGPLTDLNTTDGYEARREWWRQVLAGGDYDGLVDKNLVNDPSVMEMVFTRLNENPEEILWIWAAQNKHDVSGYYWLVSQLKEYQGRVFILYLNNLPFINEKGNIFYPVNLHEIPAKEFLKAKKLARPITLSEFEVDPDEWTRLCNEQQMVRILEGGKKLIQAGADFYDDDIRKFIGADWQKASRIIHQFLAKNKHTTGDAYILWRLKGILAEAPDTFEVNGNVKNMKDFEIRIKAGQASPA